jgi:hypothetical protein
MSDTGNAEEMGGWKPVEPSNCRRVVDVHDVDGLFAEEGSTASHAASSFLEFANQPSVTAGAGPVLDTFPEKHLHAFRPQSVGYAIVLVKDRYRRVARPIEVASQVQERLM